MLIKGPPTNNKSSNYEKPGGGSNISPAAFGTQTPKPVAKTVAKTPAEKLRDAAGKARQEAESKRRAEQAPGREGRVARMKGVFGFGSAGSEEYAKMLTRKAGELTDRQTEMANKAKAEAAAKTKKTADRIAAGSKPGATRNEMFYAKNPNAMRKGGSVDGIAQRGKTRASTRRK
jgi:hypothetical protein